MIILNKIQETSLRTVVGASFFKVGYSPTRAKEYPSLLALERLGLIQVCTKHKNKHWRANHTYISTEAGNKWVRETDKR